MSNKLANPVAAESMSKMYLDAELADVHFVFPHGDPAEKLPAHRVILATTSPVFKAMFFGPLKEGDAVKIDDSNAKAFKEFLQFFYLPEVTLSIENIEEVVRLADKYDMLECFETCAEFLQTNLTIDNMVWGYQLAIILNNAQLMGFCERHIQIQTEEILRSDMFLHCSREVIDHVLKMNVLNCDENQLFDACIKWAKALCQKNGMDETNAEHVKNQLGTQFYSIRFGAIKQEEFAIILQSKVIEFTRDELADIVLSKWAQDIESNFFNHKPRSSPWNAADELVGVRKYQIVTSYSIQQQECTWFSSSDRILLGEIIFLSVINNGVYSVEIVEHDKNNFANDAPTELLYSKSSIGLTSNLMLDKVIVIQPNKMYEIRLRRTTTNNGPNHSYAWISGEVKLDDNINITYHQNPSENNRRGLVYSLCFNRIN